MLPERGSHDAEVDELRPPKGAIDQQDVAWLDVPMNDPNRVRRREPLREPLSELDDMAEIEVPAALGRARELIAQAFAFDPLEGEVGRAIVCHAMLEVAHDVGMFDLTERRGLERKPTSRRWRTFVKHFERDVSLRLPVEGAIDDPHSTAPGLLFNGEAVGKNALGATGANLVDASQRAAMLRGRPCVRN
ncbi:hypothetical protein LZC94_19375 [Pendulispora albinea]|uniref:Uncharacterized protein n=1 Tax=Pendulispora albinea TaxID=2741071 RepID=A0ABZ2MA39_9BACT